MNEASMSKLGRELIKGKSEWAKVFLQLMCQGHLVWWFLLYPLLSGQV